MIKTILNGLSAVGNLLDLPGSSVRDTLAGRNPFDQYLSPLSDVNRTSGRGLLRHHGLIGHEDTWGNFAGGLAAETLLDPMNLIPGKAVANAFKAKRMAKATNLGVDAANAASFAKRQAGHLPEENLLNMHPKVLSTTATGSPTPRTFYHGTPRAYEQIDPNLLRDENLHGKGFYATDNTHIAGGPGGYWEKEMRHPKLDYEHPEIVDREGLGKWYQNYYAKQEPLPNNLRDINYAAERGMSLYKELHRSQTNPFPGELELFNDISRFVKPTSIPGDPANVRLMHMDLRNPFDIDAMHDVGKLKDFPPEMLVNKTMPDLSAKSLIEQATNRRNKQRGTVRHLISEVKEGKQLAAKYPTNPVFSRNLGEAVADLKTEFARRNDPPRISGDAYSQHIKDIAGVEQIQPMLKQMGYDSIVHTGGRGKDTLKHQVAIAFDPSQVYKPYIAPAFKDYVPVPSTTPAVSSMGIYHALARQPKERR